MTRRSHRAWLVCAAVAIIAAGSCLGGQTSRPPETGCTTDPDCDEGLLCQYGECRAACVFDRDCADGESCLPAPGGETNVCVSAEECPTGTEVAPDGLCRVPCPESRFCGRGRECVDGFCMDLPMSAPCVDGLDNDSDGWVDLEDPDCWRGGGEEPGGLGTTHCNDGLDNDDDGLADAADPDCTDAYALEEPLPAYCSDGEDNDGDGWVDLEDPGCYWVAVLLGPADVPEGGFLPGYECNDGLDNDLDGATDAEDVDCRVATQPLEAALPESCTDLVDNDGDSWVDVLDLDCQDRLPGGESQGWGLSLCNNGLDDDFDGLTDFDDPECCYGGDNLEASPFTDICTDGIDQGPNGWADELDVTCAVGMLENTGIEAFEFFECDDWVDNDGDGRVDANDPECDAGFDVSERY